MRDVSGDHNKYENNRISRGDSFLRRSILTVGLGKKRDEERKREKTSAVSECIIRAFDL